MPTIIASGVQFRNAPGLTAISEPHSRRQAAKDALSVDAPDGRVTAMIDRPTYRISRKARGVAAAALVATAGVGVGATVLPLGDAGAVSGQRASVSHVARIDARLIAHFKLFRHAAVRLAHAASADTAWPSAVERDLAALGASSEAQNLGLDMSSVIQQSTAAASVWVVPGANGACLVTAIPGAAATGTACAPTATILAKGLISVSGLATPGTPSTDLVAGLLPNGNQSVQVVQSGKSTAGQVQNNITTAVVPDAALTMTFQDADGQQQTFSYPGPNQGAHLAQ